MGKETKSKAADADEAAQEKASKKLATSNGVKRKSVSSETVSAQNGGSSKKMKKGNLGSEKAVEATRGKKRTVEETQGKPKPNASKSVNSESVSRKEKKSEPRSPTSTSNGRISKLVLSSENSNAKRKKKENGSKKLKIDPATVDEVSSKKSVKDRNLYSEKQGKSDKQNNGNEKNGTANKPSERKLQNKLVLKIQLPNPSSATKKYVKPSQTRKEVSTSKNQKSGPSKSAISFPAEKHKEPSARTMKVMRTLGLVAPVGSPFVR